MILVRPSDVSGDPALLAAIEIEERFGTDETSDHDFGDHDYLSRTVMIGRLRAALL